MLNKLTKELEEEYSNIEETLRNEFLNDTLDELREYFLKGRLYQLEMTIKHLNITKNKINTEV